MNWDKSDYWLPQRRYRKQLFHGPPKKMLYSSTFHDGHFSCLSSFHIPQVFRNRYNYLLLCRGVLRPFLKPGISPFMVQWPWFPVQVSLSQHSWNKYCALLKRNAGSFCLVSLLFIKLHLVPNGQFCEGPS